MSFTPVFERLRWGLKVCVHYTVRLYFKLPKVGYGVSFHKYLLTLSLAPGAVA